jgi:hypothetical protein
MKLALFESIESIEKKLALFESIESTEKENYLI